ncbi:MAG: hypothetical protein KAJ14_03965 [Candidatus Omnitrophica bacterium]|nr:hypothetical protein [Candidatus Omnitrophota bacterium]
MPKIIQRTEHRIVETKAIKDNIFHHSGIGGMTVVAAIANEISVIKQNIGQKFLFFFI